MTKLPENMIAVKYCKTDEEVCEFLSEQSRKYNLNVVVHWLVPYKDGIKIFYQNFD